MSNLRKTFFEDVMIDFFYNAIHAYKQHISPRKTWRCPHAIATGGPSCSGIALVALRRHRLNKAIAVIYRQLKGCRADCRSLRRTHGGRRTKDGELLIPCVPFV